MSLTNGDGLLVRGRTLYVVQNQLNQVAVFKLNRRGTAGTLVKTLTVPTFDVPTTVAAYRGSLYLPNARFRQRRTRRLRSSGSTASIADLGEGLPSDKAPGLAGRMDRPAPC